MIRPPWEKGLICVYFAFTTLSTVGFGDYYPHSTYEQLVGSFMLLFGVAIFSLFMGVFIEMIDKFKEVNAELDNGDGLAKFFGVMRRFNHNVDIRLDLKKKIEKYFEYRWSQDRNHSFSEESDQAIFDQLPEFVQNNLMTTFLFKDFLTIFRESF